MENLEELTFEFGCKVGVLLTFYLSLPLGAPHNSLATWHGVEHRFRKRLTMWKQQHISRGGRLTLIRNILSSLPIYFMSLIWMSKVVSLRLEQIQRDFLWERGILKRKPHLVK